MKFQFQHEHTKSYHLQLQLMGANQIHYLVLKMQSLDHVYLHWIFQRILHQDLRSYLVYDLHDAHVKGKYSLDISFLRQIIKKLFQYCNILYQHNHLKTDNHFLQCLLLRNYYLLVIQTIQRASLNCQINHLNFQIFL